MGEISSLSTSNLKLNAVCMKVTTLESRVNKFCKADNMQQYCCV